VAHDRSSFKPPKKKNPQKRQMVPTLPPQALARGAGADVCGRTRGVSAAALRGMRRCAVSAARCLLQCLSVDLAWRETARAATVIAETRIHASPDPYYRERLPWRSGLVRLDPPGRRRCAICMATWRAATRSHLAQARQGRQGVMIALPRKDRCMEDDPQLRELTAHPRTGGS
jgi:hypothetical protein